MERKKYESDLGAALRVSECSMILELAEVLRGASKRKTRSGRVSTTRPLPITWDKQVSIKCNGTSKRATGAI